jgi:hypothetical protein
MGRVQELRCHIRLLTLTSCPRKCHVSAPDPVSVSLLIALPHGCPYFLFLDHFPYFEKVKKRPSVTVAGRRDRGFESNSWHGCLVIVFVYR